LDSPTEEELVLDVAFIALTIVFLIASVGYVTACDRLMK